MDLQAFGNRNLQNHFSFWICKGSFEILPEKKKLQGLYTLVCVALNGIQKNANSCFYPF
jgi:hypothetical protein